MIKRGKHADAPLLKMLFTNIDIQNILQKVTFRNKKVNNYNPIHTIIVITL